MAEPGKTPLEKFVNDRREWEDKDIQLAQAYFLSQILDRTERTRSNTSILVWWLIALPIIVFFLLLFFGALGMRL